MSQQNKEERRSRTLLLPTHSNLPPKEGDEDEPHFGGFSSGEEPPRHTRRERRHQPNLNDIRVEVLEFKGKLDTNEFLEWLQTMERVFEFKEIPEDKKVKLVAPKLRKYASLWWTNLLTKRARPGNGKIWTWEKMNSQLKPVSYPLLTFKTTTLNSTTSPKEP